MGGEDYLVVMPLTLDLCVAQVGLVAVLVVVTHPIFILLERLVEQEPSTPEVAVVVEMVALLVDLELSLLHILQVDIYKNNPLKLKWLILHN